jgi:hypothetical protein
LLPDRSNSSKSLNISVATSTDDCGLVIVSSASLSVDQLRRTQTSFKIILELRQEPFEHVRFGFVGQNLHLQHLIKQVVKSAYPHALGLVEKRVADPNIDAQPLLYSVGLPERSLPLVFILTCIGELVATSA